MPREGGKPTLLLLEETLQTLHRSGRRRRCPTTTTTLCKNTSAACGEGSDQRGSAFRRRRHSWSNHASSCGNGSMLQPRGPQHSLLGARRRRLPLQRSSSADSVDTTEEMTDGHPDGPQSQLWPRGRSMVHPTETAVADFDREVAQRLATPQGDEACGAAGRETLCDYLTEKYLCGLLDPLPRCPAVTRARRYVVASLEKLARGDGGHSSTADSLRARLRAASPSAVHEDSSDEDDEAVAVPARSKGGQSGGPQHAGSTWRALRDGKAYLHEQQLKLAKGVPGEPQAGTTNSEGWTCNVCTRKNEASRDLCCTCGRLRNHTVKKAPPCDGASSLFARLKQRNQAPDSQRMLEQWRTSMENTNKKVKESEALSEAIKRVLHDVRNGTSETHSAPQGNGKPMTSQSLKTA